MKPCDFLTCAHTTRSPDVALIVLSQLAGILGISATAGAKALSHTVSFALILAIVSNLAQYTYWRSTSRTCAAVCHLVLLSCCSRPYLDACSHHPESAKPQMINTQCRGSTWRRLGPTIVLLLAIPLTAADPLRHVLQGAPGMMVETAAVRLLP
jgi:hypothetical protein